VSAPARRDGAIPQRFAIAALRRRHPGDITSAPADGATSGNE
jgi:hypothetical protein